MFVELVSCGGGLLDLGRNVDQKHIAGVPPSAGSLAGHCSVPSAFHLNGQAPSAYHWSVN